MTNLFQNHNYSIFENDESKTIFVMENSLNKLDRLFILMQKHLLVFNRRKFQGEWFSVL